MKYYYIMILFILSCSTVNEVVNPLENPLTSWIFDKSCISVDIPSITLTAEKTSFEKQILGENTELFKEGWLIASMNYVNPQKELVIEPEIKKEIEIINAYHNTLEYLMINNYIGIDPESNLLIVPDKFRTTTIIKYKQIALDVIEIVNVNKNKVYQYFLKKDKTLAEEFLKQFYKNYSDLGWNYDQKLGWFKK